MDKEKILERWNERAKNVQDSHYDSSARLRQLHYMTGVPLVVLSALSTSTLLVELGKFDSFDPYSKLAVAVISLLVTMLAAVQAFMGFEKRSELHYRAGAKYGAMKRELECCDPATVSDARLEELRMKWDALTEETPIIPLNIWKKNDEKKKREKEEAERQLKHAGNAALK